MKLQTFLFGVLLAMTFVPSSLQQSSTSTLFTFKTLSKTPNSLEIQAHQLLYPGPNHQPCHENVVWLSIPSSKDPDKTKFHLVRPAHQVLDSGRFILGDLEAGTRYLIRVACKDQGNSVGAPSEPPYSETTPILRTTSQPQNPGKPQTTNEIKESDDSNHKSSDSKENAGNRQSGLLLSSTYPIILTSLWAIN